MGWMVCIHRKYRDFCSLIAVLSKFLFMSLFVCHRTSVCLCFNIHLCSRAMLMLLRQEVENLPPHLADEFCKSATFYEQGREGREKKRGEGMWLPAAVYGLRASREFCMTSPSEGAEYTEPFQQSSRTPLFIFVYGMMGNLTAAETNWHPCAASRPRQTRPVCVCVFILFLWFGCTGQGVEWKGWRGCEQSLLFRGP